MLTALRIWYNRYRHLQPLQVITINPVAYHRYEVFVRHPKEARYETCNLSTKD